MQRGIAALTTAHPNLAEAFAYHVQSWKSANSQILGGGKLPNNLLLSENLWIARVKSYLRLQWSQENLLQ